MWENDEKKSKLIKTKCYLQFDRSDIGWPNQNPIYFASPQKSSCHVKSYPQKRPYFDQWLSEVFQGQRRPFRTCHSPMIMY